MKKYYCDKCGEELDDPHLQGAWISDGRIPKILYYLQVFLATDWEFCEDCYQVIESNLLGIINKEK